MMPLNSLDSASHTLVGPGFVNILGSLPVLLRHSELQMYSSTPAIGASQAYILVAGYPYRWNHVHPAILRSRLLPCEH